MDDEESIYNLIKYEKYEGKKPMYRSKHNPFSYPTGSTFGLQNSGS